MNTLRLRATGATIDIVHNGQHFAPDVDGVFSIPADVATELVRLPLGLEVAPDTSEPAPRAVDFLAPSPFASFDVGAIGFRKYEAFSDSVVYGVAPEHCAAMVAHGCVPLTPAGWVDPRTA